MLAGELPWDKPIAECADFVSWVKNNYQKTPWCKIENTALSLMRNILNFDPVERFSIKQIKSSAWFMRTYKNSTYEPTSLNENDSNGWGFLSQPAYIYFNDSMANSTTSTKSSFLGTMATELEVTDSLQNCECSTDMHSNNMPLNNATNHFESFSQPISTENMFLNSQINATQTLNSQFGSQFQSQAAASQSPLLKLVKRMTRMFVHSNAEGATEELRKVFHKCMYEFKVTITNQRQRQITVSTSDKRQTLLTFKVNIIEMNCQNEVLVDFRLSKGDGLEFKKIFMKIKTSLSHIVCKRYVFKNSHACCDKR